MGGKSVFHLTTCSPPFRGVTAGTWRLELKWKPWRSSAYWLAFPALHGLLFYITQDLLPSGGPPTVGWALSRQSRKYTIVPPAGPSGEGVFFTEVLSSLND